MRYLALFALMFTLFNAAPAPLHAEESGATSETTSKWHQGCETRQERLQERIDAIARAHAERYDAYVSMVEKLKSTASMLEEKGMDASDISADASTLEGYVSELASNSDALVAQLTSMRDMDCETSTPETFKAELDEAKVHFEALKVTVANIKDFYQNTIKPHLEEAKAQAESSEESGS